MFTDNQFHSRTKMRMGENNHSKNTIFNINYLIMLKWNLLWQHKVRGCYVIWKRNMIDDNEKHWLTSYKRSLLCVNQNEYREINSLKAKMKKRKPKSQLQVIKNWGCGLMLVLFLSFGFYWGLWNGSSHKINGKAWERQFVG